MTPARTHDDPILTISVVVLSLAAGNLLLLLVPATLAIIRCEAVDVDIGIPLVVRPLDLILLVAMLVTQMTLGFFYHYVLPYAGETLPSQVVSLVLAILLFVSTFLVADASLFPWRLYVVAVPMTFVVYKNWVLARRFRGTAYAPVVERWYSNIRWGFVANIVGATLFLALFHPPLADRALAVFFAPPIRTTPAYTTWLPAVFYSVLLVAALRSLIRNYTYFVSVGASDADALSAALNCERPWVPGIPRTLWAVARLTRVHTMIVAGVLVTKVGMALGARTDTALLAAAAMAFALGGAFAVNDICDRKSDAQNVPGRPIPSGIVSVSTAAILGGASVLTAITCALATRNGGMIVMTAALIVLLLVYSYRLKCIVVVKNVTMAVVGASVPLFGAVAAGAVTEPRAWWLVLIIGFFVLQKEIAADIYDYAGDTAVGLRTLPIVVGTRHAAWSIAAVNILLTVTAAAWLVIGGGAVGLQWVAALGVLNVVGALLVARDAVHIKAFLTAQKTIHLGGVVVALLI
jgi:geranylgeranylglycerol-phosphate geranylgeranyltransferase